MALNAFVPYYTNNSQVFKSNLISFSGGGTRGVILTTYLEQISKQLSLKEQQIVFDNNLFCGSSVGGILSACYVMGMSFSEVSDIAKTVAKKIFPSKAGAWAWTKYVTSGTPLYNVQDLKQVAQEIFKNTLVDELEKPIMLSAVAVKGEGINRLNKPCIITNIQKIKQTMPEFYVKPWTIVDAVVSTANAPIYFNDGIKGYDRGDDFTYLDGGLMNNNPEQLGLSVLQSLYPQTNYINCLSLGTGTFIEHNPWDNFKKLGYNTNNLGIFITDVIKYLIDTLSSMPEAYSNFEMSFKQYTDINKKYNYLKLSPFLDRRMFDDLDLDNADDSYLEKLKEHTRMDFVEKQQQIIEFMSGWNK